MTGRIVVLAGIMILVEGCGGGKQREVDVKTFPIRGVVVSVDRQEKRIMIAHEEIPNYMMAMTMPFKVKDTTLLTAVRSGDSVEGTLAVSRTESWIETIGVIGKNPTPPLSGEQVLFRHLFREGDVLPDMALTNQDGIPVRFSKYHGQVVALTFIYTRCPLPDFCIRMSDNFSNVQRLLKSDQSLRDRWHLLSVSFDPEHDTPAVLKQEAKKYSADLDDWEFVTGAEPTIDKLTDGFDLMVKPDAGLIEHTLRTALLDGDGRLVKVIKGNDWKPEDLVSDIKKLIRKRSS